MKYFVVSVDLDCPMNKWGILCDKECPECLNGGVCHDKDGDCICPPGFMGTRCETGIVLLEIQLTGSGYAALIFRTFS